MKARSPRVSWAEPIGSGPATGSLRRGEAQQVSSSEAERARNSSPNLFACRLFPFMGDLPGNAPEHAGLRHRLGPFGGLLQNAEIDQVKRFAGGIEAGRQRALQPTAAKPGGRAALLPLVHRKLLDHPAL